MPEESPQARANHARRARMLAARARLDQDWLQRSGPAQTSARLKFTLMLMSQPEHPRFDPRWSSGDRVDLTGAAAFQAESIYQFSRDLAGRADLGAPATTDWERLESVMELLPDHITGSRRETLDDVAMGLHNDALEEFLAALGAQLEEDWNEDGPRFIYAQGDTYSLLRSIENAEHQVIYYPLRYVRTTAQFPGTDQIRGEQERLYLLGPEVPGLFSALAASASGPTQRDLDSTGGEALHQHVATLRAALL